METIQEFFNSIRDAIVDMGTTGTILVGALAALLVLLLVLAIVNTIKKSADKKAHREKMSAGRDAEVVLQRPKTLSKVCLLGYNEQVQEFSLEFQQKSWARTVKYYTECNYVRTPHYTPWQEASDKKVMALKATLETMEGLRNSPTALIAANAEKIVEAVCPKMPALKPSWYGKTGLQISYEKYVNDLDEKCEAAILQKENEIAQLDLDYEKQLKEYYEAENEYAEVELRSKMSTGRKKASQAAKVDRKFDSKLANLRIKADKVKMTFPEYFEKKAAAEAAIAKYEADRDTYLRQAQMNYQQQIAKTNSF